MIEYTFSLFVLLLLMILAVIFPASIAPSYLFLSNFFIVDLPILPMNSSKLYCLFVMLFFLKNFFHSPKQNLKNRDFWIMAGVLWSIPTILGFYHLSVWKVWPHLYYWDQIKALWALGFFFLPAPKISLRVFVISCLAFFAISILMVFPLSFDYYLKTGRGLGRYLAPYWGVKEVTGPDGKFWPIIDDNVYENLSVFSSILGTSLIYFLIEKRHRYVFLLSILFLLSAYVFYINQFLMTLVMLGLNLLFAMMFFSWRYRQKHRKQLQILCTLVAVVGIGSGVFFYQELAQKFSDRFQKREIANEDHPQNYQIFQMNRLTALKVVFKNFWQNAPWRGYGFFTTYRDIYNDDFAPLTHSGHSTIIDHIISFGLFWGLLGLFVYLVPFLILSFYGGRLYAEDPYVFCGFLLVSMSVFLMSLETIYGRESLQVGFLYSLSTILLAKLRAKE